VEEDLLDVNGRVRIDGDRIFAFHMD